MALTRKYELKSPIGFGPRGLASALVGLASIGIVSGAIAASAENAIVVLVNDDPITAYEVAQRGKLLALNANIGGYIKANAKKRWEKIVKSPKINDEFRAYATKRNPKSQDELKKIQQDFIRDKQKVMMQQLQGEAQAQAARGTQKKAIQELVEERLKLQAAKQNNVEASDDEVTKIISGIAERNKMTAAQFAKHMASRGVDIATMRQRFKATISWNSVVRRRFGFQVQGTERDIERFVDPALSGISGGASENVMINAHKVTLAMPDGLEQGAVASQLAKADQMRRKFSGCKSTKKLASSAGGKFEDLGSLNPASIPEPTRTLLLSADSGEMLPPNVGPDGVELWAVCSKKAVASQGGDDQAGAGGSRSSESSQRRSRELDILARKHLKDLRQDATIDCRAEAKSGLCQAL
ncbi:MAG: hypothetical protein ACK5KM_05605 [Hyphomicrobiaceae bacterium]